MLKKILSKLFYNPYKFIKNYHNIVIEDSTILLKSCNFRFDDGCKTNSVYIGSGSMVGCNFIFESEEGEIRIGKNTFINGGTNIISRTKIIIGNNVTIAWHCTIYDHNSHSLNYLDRRKEFEIQKRAYSLGKPFSYGKNWNIVKSKPIIIEDDVWIGFDAVILAGVTIGKGAIIGARSVVRKNVKPYTIVIGNPAIEIKNINE